MWHADFTNQTLLELLHTQLRHDIELYFSRRREWYVNWREYQKPR